MKKIKLIGGQAHRIGGQAHRIGGQALVTLLIFMIIAITITAASVSVMILNSRSNDKLQNSLTALQIAESGAENAILRLLRNPSYSGETLTVGEGVATITVEGYNPVIATSEGKLNNFLRKIQVKMNNNNGFFTILSWKEIF